MCTQRHPAHPDWDPCVSNRPDADHYSCQFFGPNGEQAFWDNPNYVQRSDKNKAQRAEDLKDKGKVVRENRRELRAERRAMSDHGPLARHDDAWTAQLGAERIEPKVETRCGEVLALLRENIGQWVKGHRLCTPTCGGSEGLRRVRQCRKDFGWNIQCRTDPDSQTAFEYMLVPDGDTETMAAEVPVQPARDAPRRLMAL